MRPNERVDPAYLEAFAGIVSRIADSLRNAPKATLPLKMFVAGGAALCLHTGARASVDIDATFSKRLVLADDLSLSYRDPDGRARVLYVDRNYNDTLGLLHEDANADSVPVIVPGVDRKFIDVRVLSPIDLAVSKLSRFSVQDRRDIEELARAGLVDARKLRRRAEEALAGYIGNTDQVKAAIDAACRAVDAVAPRRRSR